MGITPHRKEIFLTMRKIKLLTDSACDIDKEFEKKYDIKIMNFPVSIDGKSYREREDFTNEQFYAMMDSSPEIPKTSQITAYEFEIAFNEIFTEGYTDIIVVTISSTGSNTYNSAVLARENFFENHKDTSNLHIHIVDSRNYTGVYGYPLMQSAIKISKGAEPGEVINYLNEWFECAGVYFASYNLKYAKKSGRISAAAAFAGELLGLRPIIKISDGVSKVIDKVRGEKNIIPKLVEIAQRDMIPKTPYIIITGSDPTVSDELEKELTKKLGYSPEWTCQIGAAVASNAGHKVAGFVIRSVKNN